MFLGIFASFYDIKFYKIKNSFILVGFLIGSINFLILSILKLFNLWDGPFFKILNHAIVGVFIITLLGYLFWKLHFFSAGDAKFLSLMVFLLPPSFREFFKYSYFLPFFNIILNIFLLLFLYILLDCTIGVSRLIADYILGRVNRKDFFDFKKIDFKRAMDIILGYVCLILLIGIFTELKIFFSLAFSLGIYLLLFFLIPFLNKIFTHYRKVIYVLLCIELIFIIFWSEFKSKDYFWIIKNAKFFIFFGLFVYLSNFYFSKKEINKIPIEKLHSGLVLTDSMKRKIRGLIKESDLCNLFVRFRLERLNNSDIEKLKALLREKNIKYVECYKCFPLIPFIFLGTMTTIMIKTNLWEWLLS
jgi:Flp pilus assembly protein protease CpaA